MSKFRQKDGLLLDIVSKNWTCYNEWVYESVFSCLETMTVLQTKMVKNLYAKILRSYKNRLKLRFALPAPRNSFPKNPDFPRDSVEKSRSFKTNILYRVILSKLDFFEMGRI